MNGSAMAYPKCPDLIETATVRRIRFLAHVVPDLLAPVPVEAVEKYSNKAPSVVMR